MNLSEDCPIKTTLLDLCQYRDILTHILSIDINAHSILAFASVSLNMRRTMTRTFQRPIPLPLYREFTEEAYIVIVMNGAALSKAIKRYYHNKAIREGYFPILRDFAPFSRKISLAEFTDMLADVPPSCADAYNPRPVIPRSVKQQIAAFYKRDVDRGANYIAANLDKQYMIVQVAYNILHEIGNYKIAKQHVDKLHVMFANASDEVIKGYFDEKKDNEMRQRGFYARTYGRTDLYTFYNHTNIPRVIRPVESASFSCIVEEPQLNKPTISINFSCPNPNHYVHVSGADFKIAMRTHSEEQINTYIKNLKLGYQGLLEWYEIAIEYNKMAIFELLHLWLDNMHQSKISAYKKLICMAKAAFNLPVLKLLGEHMNWEYPLTEKNYALFEKKYLKAIK